MIVKVSQRENLARFACIGIVALASAVVFIGCGDTPPPGDTTPPASVAIRNFTVASESIAFGIANPNAEAVRVTLSLTPAPPAVARVVADGGEPRVLAGANINLTNRGTDDYRKQIRITGLTNGTAYTVILTAADSNGNSQPQIVAESATPLAPPNAPTLTVVRDDTSVALTWLAPTDGTEVTGYRIYRRDDSMNSQFALLTSLQPVLRTYIDVNLDNSAAYRYRIRAINANGTESADSNVAPPLFHLHANGVTVLCPFAANGATGMVNGVTYTKRTAQNIRDRLDATPMAPETRASIDLDAARSCTSGITDMTVLDNNTPRASAGLFQNNATFNEDINHWDTSRVTNMHAMFASANNFNQNIDSWNVAAVTDMSSMFRNTIAFNGDIDSWNVGMVTDMSHMFRNTNAFDRDIGSWNVAAVTSMSNMFNDTTVFNKDVGRWNVARVTDMNAMFFNAISFNKDIGRWNVGAVTDMGDMFGAAESFNQNIGSWNVVAVENMTGMFWSADNFNQDLSGWRPLCISSKPSDFDTGTATGFVGVANRQPTWATTPLPASCSSS